MKHWNKNKLVWSRMRQTRAKDQLSWPMFSRCKFFFLREMWSYLGASVKLSDGSGTYLVRIWRSFTCSKLSKRLRCTADVFCDCFFHYFSSWGPGEERWGRGSDTRTPFHKWTQIVEKAQNLSRTLKGREWICWTLQSRVDRTSHVFECCACRF